MTDETGEFLRTRRSLMNRLKGWIAPHSIHKADSGASQSLSPNGRIRSPR